MSRGHGPLTDAFGRPLQDLRVSVTDRCNFRCPFCMPHESLGFRYQFLPKSEILSFEEIERVVRVFVGLGVRTVHLTGGEPLLRTDIEALISLLARIPGLEDLAMTTNGFLLAGKARALKEAGLKRVTVSLHSLDEETFGRMNGRGFTPQRVLEGIQAALEVGLVPVKVNVVVQRGVNDHDFTQVARFFKGRATVRFIEYMDVGTLNGWRMDQVVPALEVLQRLEEEVGPLEPVGKGYGDTALRFRYRDGSGEVGVIASVTQPFCGDCNRIRLSAEGKLYTCLFASQGHDLKSLLRSGATEEDLREFITALWRRRTDRYSEERARMTAPPPQKVEMFRVGG